MMPHLVYIDCVIENVFNFDAMYNTYRDLLMKMYVYMPLLLGFVIHYTFLSFLVLKASQMHAYVHTRSYIIDRPAELHNIPPLLIIRV